MQRLHPRTARSIYRHLLAHYGPQGWWPARSAFEVVVGAVLTQNATWTNVEYALANLRAAGRLAPAAIRDAPVDELAGWIRPSGYFNVKARRLQAVCAFWAAHGGRTGLRNEPTGPLRAALLAVHGIGRETADDILLYALDHPVFVIDAYTRRVFARLGLLDERANYEDLRAAFERALGPDVALYQEYHALIVRHCKVVCGPRPQCAACVLRRRCPYPRRH